MTWICKYSGGMKTLFLFFFFNLHPESQERWSHLLRIFAILWLAFLSPDFYSALLLTLSLQRDHSACTPLSTLKIWGKKSLKKKIRLQFGFSNPIEDEIICSHWPPTCPGCNKGLGTPEAWQESMQVVSLPLTQSSRGTRSSTQPLWVVRFPPGDSDRDVQTLRKGESQGWLLG